MSFEVILKFFLLPHSLFLFGTFLRWKTFIAGIRDVDEKSAGFHLNFSYSNLSWQFLANSHVRHVT